jgi:hypothetical protein
MTDVPVRPAGRRLVVLTPRGRGGFDHTVAHRAFEILDVLSAAVDALGTTRSRPLPVEGLDLPSGAPTSQARWSVALTTKDADRLLLEMDIEQGAVMAAKDATVRKPSTGGAALIVRTAHDDQSRHGSFGITLAAGGPRNDALPTSTTDVDAAARTIISLARDCLDQLRDDPPVEGRYPFGLAMEACAQIVWERESVRLAAEGRAVFSDVRLPADGPLLIANSATPWSRAVIDACDLFDSRARMNAPELDDTSAVVIVTCENGLLSLMPIATTASIDADPMRRLRGARILAERPLRPDSPPPEAAA